MKLQVKILLLSVVLTVPAIRMNSQVITGSEFTPSPSDAFTDSPITMSHYGLTWGDFSNNTTGPSAMLSGYGGINLYTAGTRRLTINHIGNIGIGTTTPHYLLETAGFVKASLSNTNPSGVIIGAPYSEQPRIGFNASDDSMRFKIQINALNAPSERLAFYAGPVGSTATNETMSINGTGNVGIGTTSPTRKLHIAGDVQIDGSLYFGSSSQPQSAAFSGVICGGDYAESVDVTGTRSTYVPGDLLMIDKHDPSKFVKSSEPYSTMVAGVYSTKPGTVGRRQSTPRSTEEIPMAVIGIVPAKVSAENGAIEAGDLLVSSSTPGYAMKGTDRVRMLGAVIGKAMGTLSTGVGVIEVLVTLQ